MATTRIIPLHLNKGKTINQCLADRTDYAKNPMKTDQGNLVSSFACDPDFVASEFDETELLFTNVNAAKIIKIDIIIVGIIILILLLSELN